VTGSRKILYLSGAVVTLLLLLSVGVTISLQSPWLHEKVRQRIVYEVERATGGRAEIGAFRFDWKQLRAEVAPLVLHGTEPPGEAPLFRAESVQIGLKVVSILRRDIDIKFLTIDQPKVNLLVDANGKTNVPEPKIKLEAASDPLEQIIRLAIERVEIRDGLFVYNSRAIPLNVRSNDLKLSMRYERASESYVGDLTTKSLRLTTEQIGELTLDRVDAAVQLAANRIRILSSKIAMGTTVVETVGELRDLKKIQVAFTVKGDLAMKDLAGLKLPVEPQGSVHFEGDFEAGQGRDVAARGKISGSGLGYRLNDILVQDIRMETDISASRERIDLSRLRVAAMGGVFEGGAMVEGASRFSVSGNLKDLSLARLAEWNKQKGFPWSSMLSGSVQISGRAQGKQLRDGIASVHLRLQPDSGEIPLAGELNVGWQQKSKQIRVDSSFLQTPATRVNFAGALGERLDVGVLSSDLDDFLPVMRLLSGTTPSIPVALNRGEARFNGSVLGPLEQPRVAGKITLRNVTYQGRNFDTLEVDLEAAEQKLTLSQVLLTHGPLHLEGRASLGLDKWKLGDASPITGRASIRGAELAELLTLAGSNLPVKGLLSATVNLAGTLSALNAGARLRIDKLSAWNEQFDRLEATVDVQEDVVNLTSGRLHRNGALIEAKGAYRRDVQDWSSGSIRLSLSTAGMTLAALDSLQRLKVGLSGEVEVKTELAGRIANKQFHLDNVDGRLVVRNISLEKHPLGGMAVSAETRNRQVMLSWDGSLRKSQIRGEGQIELRDGYPGRGKLSFSRLAFAEIEPLLQRKSTNQGLPFDGFIDGEATFEGNMTQPESLRADVRVDSFELHPKTEGQAAADLVLRNASPLLFAVDSKGVNIKSAEFVARDTDLVASGSLSFQSRNPWDLKLKGKVNLGILKSFSSDLLADGSSTIDAAVRGSLDAPRLSGRMELSNASFYLRDVPNGIEKANGVVLFNQDRASIEKLTAQTGGGRLDLSGFVGFGGNEYVYMLRAALDKVRVRYPEGVSTTIDAALSLTGTSSRSLLGGTVTVIRSGFNPRTDLGGLLAQTSRRAPPPASNNTFLRGMQFDVRIETAPNVQFQTSLTRDLQMEANLRLRGSPSKPVVLGNIAVNRGEIQFFGNRYTITRGDISFFNSAKIDPVLDIDLETRVRAVTVNINFSGPIDKLNVTYRSDPPLQSSEITALLTVGRTPTATDPNLSTARQNSNQSLFQTGANSLLGQAVAAPISGRLERFFGVSRLKIDPQLNGIDNIPQARLTLEQQISKDITLTYVTNLTRSQQQLVRLEWNMSQFWSVIAVRDENGLFGIDFQFRKRFK